MPEKQPELKLKVVESVQDDVNKGIVRIDYNQMRQINIKPGEVIEIEGARKTVAIAGRAYPSDIGGNMIRMDVLIRKNASTSLGELVKARRSDNIKEAKRVVIAPAKKNIYIRTSQDILKRSLLGRAVVKGDIISLGGAQRRRSEMEDSPFSSMFPKELFKVLEEHASPGFIADLRFIVIETNPQKAPVIITENTEVFLNPEAVEIKEEIAPDVAYEDIGGLSEEIKKIREMVELPLKHPEIFERLGIEPPKGVLLHGPPGTGKTLLAKAVANETNSHFILINGPEIMSKFYGQSEENLRKKFEEAEKNAPSIVFVDEIDAIAPKREEVKGEVERRVVAQLLTLMDGLKSRGKVVVIAATNVPNILDPALRRPGRFDREIDIGVPSKEGRNKILRIHTRNMPLAKDVNIDEIASITYGFVGADLASLCKEAAMIVLRRILPDLKLDKEESIPKEMLERLYVTKKDFFDALKTVRPSAMREVLVEIPNVKWNDIGGLEKVKQELKEAVEWPLKNPEVFKRMGVKPPKGILIYGAPGTGKTLLAKAVATESKANFILVKGPELLCISEDTNIFTDFCGVRKIEEFYNSIVPFSKMEESTGKLEVRRVNKPVHTYAVSSDGRMIKTPIKTVHKLWVDDCYELEFANNNKLIGSKNQPLLIFRDNNIQWIKLEDIEIGDYIAYPSVLPTFNKQIKLPFPKYGHINKVGEDNSNYYGKIFSTKQITKLPKYITPQLASFLGWFVSEGNVSKEGISICNYNKENQKEIAELFKQFVDKERITIYKDKVVVYSTVIVKYLEEIFGQTLGTKKCSTIKCPNIITKASEEVISSFLRSAYKGDGSITKTKIEYCSKSKQLVEGMTYMLTLIGVKFKFWQRKEDDAYMITISGKKEMALFKEKIFNQKIDSKIRKEYNARYIIPPVASLLKEMKEILNLHYDKDIPDGSFEHAISGRRRLGLLRLRQIMQIYNRYATKSAKKSEAYRILSMISNGDILWTTVKNKKRANPQVMYDVETKDGSFIGGNMPLILHNSKWVGESEKAVREVFKKARQTSPTIIFFDELDSLAPRRGSSSESHVIESVVNQLLAEMDGLEELHDVVIIAATNRPDIVDPALLRPGRFDRIILTPIPGKEERKKIFDIHTKGMPLKAVSTEKLAEKTEGYVGADIESLCREAAMLALREDLKAKEITMKHFTEALKDVGPSVSHEIEKTYEEMKNAFKAARAKEMQQEKPSYMG